MIQAEACTTVNQPENNARPSNFMCLACFVSWCCKPPLGVLGFYFSKLSSDAVVEKDMARARRLGRVSLCISVTGIILTFLAVGLVLAFLAKDDNNVSNMDFLSHVHVPEIDEDFEEFEEIPIEVPVIF